MNDTAPQSFPLWVAFVGASLADVAEAAGHGSTTVLEPLVTVAPVVAWTRPDFRPVIATPKREAHGLVAAAWHRAEAVVDTDRDRARLALVGALQTAHEAARKG